MGEFDELIAWIFPGRIDQQQIQRIPKERNSRLHLKLDNQPQLKILSRLATLPAREYFMKTRRRRDKRIVFISDANLMWQIKTFLLSSLSAMDLNGSAKFLRLHNLISAPFSRSRSRSNCIFDRDEICRTTLESLANK